jgi:dihydroorotase
MRRIFEQAGALDKLEAFTSFHGADFYRLPRNQEKITLQKETWRVPADLPLGYDRLVPLRVCEMLAWRFVE